MTGRRIHKASKISSGRKPVRISPLCYKKPRSCGVWWTLTNSQVTCPKCKRMIAEAQP